MSMSVEQVAKKLNVSRTAVYNRLKEDRFKPMVITENGRTVISEELYGELQQIFKPKTESNSIDVQNIIDVLTNQLHEKDATIRDLLRLTENQQKLLGNAQRQQEEIKMIDEPKRKKLFGIW